MPKLKYLQRDTPLCTFLFSNYPQFFVVVQQRGDEFFEFSFFVRADGPCRNCQKHSVLRMHSAHEIAPTVCRSRREDTTFDPEHERRILGLVEQEDRHQKTSTVRL